MAHERKRIGIDARLYYETGVGVYLRNFLYYLQKLAPDSYQFHIYVLEKNSSQIHFENPLFIKREVRSKWHTFSEQLIFQQVLMNDRLDLMHFTYFSYPVLYRRPFIATVHDLTPLLFKTGKASTLPAFMYELKHSIFSFILKQQVQKAKAIITPTVAVKRQLEQIYGSTYSHKILALYEGVNHEFFKAEQNKALAKHFSRPFFLYVGNFYPHKNVDRLVQAFSQMNRDDIDLVLAGPDNYFSGQLEKVIEEQRLTNIHMYHPSRPEDLLFLYKNSLALINPSLSEGFGLPVVEAAYCGTPVIASDIDVFREILGNNYYAFNPSQTESIQEVLLHFLQDSHKKKPVLDSKYSFERMVTQYTKLLKDIV